MTSYNFSSACNFIIRYNKGTVNGKAFKCGQHNTLWNSKWKGCYEWAAYHVWGLGKESCLVTDLLIRVI